MVYKLGDKYSEDFDYCGMLRKGSKADIKMGVDKLQKLFDSYEDVNYHSESEPLISAIRDKCFETNTDCDTKRRCEKCY